jgi:hypothetical protein
MVKCVLRKRLPVIETDSKSEKIAVKQWKSNGDLPFAEAHRRVATPFYVRREPWSSGNCLQGMVFAKWCPKLAHARS